MESLRVVCLVLGFGNLRYVRFWVAVIYRIHLGQTHSPGLWMIPLYEATIDIFICFFLGGVSLQVYIRHTRGKVVSLK